ncbi:hypothetical protein GCM10007231_33740 [Nocardioides daphniae]|nr:hypothetical protein GCM10007231_33740 [Nocardioides daphniae]
MARAAWDAYAKAVNTVITKPLIERTPVGDGLRSISANSVADLLGFWLVWQLHGGFEGLLSLGMSRSSIFRKVAAFRKVFKQHPDEFTLPGVSIDVAEYLTQSQEED